MPHRRDPLRAHKISLLAGCAIATGMLLLDAVLGASSHGGIPGDAPLVMSRQSGALFVRVDGQLHPVANLTSARLILGSPESPRLADEIVFADVPGGPVLGIPGAPGTLGEVTARPDLYWAVCADADSMTTVVVGGDWTPSLLDPHAAAVVTAAHGDGAVYLLYDGKRAMIDPSDPATARALRLDGVVAREVSPPVLNAVPEVPAIAPPRIAHTGQPAEAAGFQIGSVVRVTRSDAPEYYVVLEGGLQRVGRLTVDLIRFADPTASAGILDVAPELIARSPLVDALAVATYPDQPPFILDSTEELCATWQSGHSGIATGPPDSGGLGSVTLAEADGDGPGIDIVRASPGRSLDISDPGAGGRYLVTSAGVRFPVSDSAVAALGLSETPAPAPWAIVGALPAGPELAREAALVGRDVVATP